MCALAADKWSSETVNQCVGDVASTYPRLASLVSEILSSYPTSIEQDEALLRGMDLTEGGRLAVAFRLSRKMLLRYALCRYYLSLSLSLSLSNLLPSTPGLFNRMFSLWNTSCSALQHKLVPRSPGQASEAETQPRLEMVVQRLNDWVAAANPPVNLIAAAHIPGMRLGAVATAHLKKEDVYLSVPPALILDVQSAG